ncbi:PREDICTED: membrane-associated tyrosine- and threonine-specific cdc2-inhibitory kinase-like [Priapulus caudatus]|uniref:non-specific serine/threonine protein kinase n=1 Tax=Priapulus caudatus TaxID=37621 RepID=A0ABM1E3K8_PRICU|nr:PREDICTED: membrane-associated tyrosine- and threonine-specific cdc2-inhibitory kinase-like [Priapulus caudatus]
MHQKTPSRPTPKFFGQQQKFSTKKERGTPRDALPPRPPVKSAPPISRVFSNRNELQRARAVSFVSTSDYIRSPHYKEANKQLYFEQCFEVECKLGEGSFGQVYKVRSKEDGRYYAVKKSQQKFRGESDRLRKLDEVRKHEVLPKHENCVEFFKAWEEKQQLYIQIELCQTSLSNYSEMNHDIPETLIWNYTVDLLLAVKHLHDHDLIHMDIKPDNIFVSQDCVCKLGDFGLVVDLKKGDISEALEGDPKYMAPELMDGKFGKAADIFSLGVTLLELATDLDVPRGGAAWHLLRSGNIPNYIFKGLQPGLCELLRLMMNPSYIRRPSADDILQMPAVQNHAVRRRRQLLSKKVVNQVMASFCAVWLMLLALWKIVLWPVQSVSLRRQSHRPPRGIEAGIRQGSGWDTSFSDDDVFENPSNLSRSFISPLSESSESNDSRNGILDALRRGAYSAPAAMKARPKVATPPRNMVPLSLLDRMTPEASAHHDHSINKSLFLETSGSMASNDESMVAPEAKVNIGPKNLMSVFAAADMSDED